MAEVNKALSVLWKASERCWRREPFKTMAQKTTLILPTKSWQQK